MRGDTGRRIADFLEGRSGATMVEMAVVLPLMLLILFALFDFGRMAFTYVKAQKGVQMAARIAIVRAPVCPDVPDRHCRNPALAPAPRFGTYCSAGGACANPGTFSCQGSTANATANEIWNGNGIRNGVAQLFPPDATVANLRFTYAFDPNLGFVGGPYTPIVTVETTGLNFNFILPIGPLGSFITGTANTFDSNPPFPTISVSMPGEDLAPRLIPGPICDPQP